MLISEITDENLVWAKLKGIELDFTTSYYEIVDLLNTLIRLRSPYRNSQWLAIIAAFEDRLSMFLNEPFGDDPDIVELKEKARRMLRNIAELKSRL